MIYGQMNNNKKKGTVSHVLFFCEKNVYYLKQGIQRINNYSLLKIKVIKLFGSLKSRKYQAAERSGKFSNRDRIS